MPSDHDAILLESVRVHRARLRAAFLHGALAHRRRTADNVRRFVGSAVLAAVLCAGCVGASFLRANVGSLSGGAPGTVSTPTPTPTPTRTSTPAPSTTPQPAPPDRAQAHR